MAQINAKPFNEGEKLQKRIYKGRPNVFSAQDLTQHFDIIDNHLKRLSDNVGMVRYNWKVNQTLEKDTLDGVINRFQSEIYLMKEDNAQPAYVYFRGLRFDIPVGDLVRYAADWSETYIPVGYIVLIAKQKTVTFADNAVIAGITSVDAPQALPSSDAVQWYGERLVYVKSKADVVLVGGEEIIGIIASVIPQDTGDVKVSTVVANNVATIDVTYAGSFKRAILYNAIKSDELTDFFTFSKGDSTIFELKFVQNAIATQKLESNGSLNDSIVFLKEYLARKDKYADLAVRTLQGRLDSSKQDLSTMQQTIASLGETIAALKKLKEIPIGGIIEWEGSFEVFDNSGKGLKDTPVAGFQICNGLNGTSDRRGRFPVMSITGIPAVNAPALQAAVDPSNPNLPAGANPNYTPGMMGGEAAHKLTLDELPKHSFDYLKPKTAENADSGGLPDYVATEEGKTNEIGNDIAHNNLPPFFATTWIKRVE